MEGENGRSFVRRRHRARSDGELLARMALQARVFSPIEATRRARGLSIQAFATIAGVGERTYRRLLSGLIMARPQTVARLRIAQRKIASGVMG